MDFRIGKIFCITLSICLFWQIRPSLKLKSVDSHLNEFLQYNVTDHDNLDDEEHKHAHRHKHSQNGEEHEHEDTKVSQNEIKVLSLSDKITSLLIKIKSKNIFFQKILISNPHPFGIFRPPIA
jgi:hypothetical protein